MGKVEDITKQMEFESTTIKNISDQKQFETPNETDQDLQMHSQHQLGDWLDMSKPSEAAQNHNTYKVIKENQSS